MDISTLLASLNQPQRDTVCATEQHMLILAGAGSGKTTVLTRRISYLIESVGISPFSILAVTFTNKAAHEMRNRIESLLGLSLNQMWVGTFHGLAHRLLRTHWYEAKLPQSFQILDADDQYRIIRRIQRGLNLEEAKWPPKQTQWFINRQKEQGQRSKNNIDHDDNYFSETLNRVYRVYEETCQRSGLVDFAELLLRSLELLRHNDDIRQHYQQRFKHILVDEFQDTNNLQYDWIKTLVGNQTFVMAVGDDDQSIYSWRGANINNIHRFTKDYHNAETIRLEQNYRSPQNVLDAANAVIANNNNRLGKKLWSDRANGEPIRLYTAFNDRDETHYIVSVIEQWLDSGRKPSEVAVLYRSNAQSRILEERLIDRKIPYRIYGGLKFFDRAEIKDALAYLRLLNNQSDDAAFERIVNTPTRGIGNITLVKLRSIARENNLSLWQAAAEVLAKNQLTSRAANALRQFVALINNIHQTTRNATLAEQVEQTLQKTTLLEHYKKDKTEKGLSRVENLEELVNAVSQFRPEEGLQLTPLDAFLSHVALETGEEQAENYSDYVSLMTLHSAKGLEFPLVIISGLEEDLFPHRMSLDEAHGLEEERRLCYVGMTRAREKLVLTYAESRRLHGLERMCQPSRFLAEIPAELIDAVRPKTRVSKPSVAPIHVSQYKEIGETGLYVGQRVHHKKFGTGTIINFEGHSEHARLQVKFEKYGTKWLVASYAKLEAL